MKKKFFLIAFGLSIVALILISCNTDSSENKTQPTSSSSTAIDGAWDLVWAKYNDTIANVGKRPLFKMFSNGVFSLFARDSSGKIGFAGYGKYELSDSNTYKETFIYNTNPEFNGAMDWQEYKIEGDTLYFKGFNKVIVGDKVVTSDFPKIEEKRVKVKW